MAARLLMLAVLTSAGLVSAAEGPLIHNMDDLRVRNPKEKGKAESAPGKFGKAVAFTFEKGCSGAFCITPIRGTDEWDNAAGFSFWVKGDGSKSFGGLQFIWNEDYAARYDLAFPIDGTDWQKVTVAWSDLTPVLPNTPFLDPKGERKPSKLSGLWIGKWWYWREYPACSFTLDELRLEPTIERDSTDLRPVGDPLARVRDKLKAGKPLRVVTMGDSLTDTAHWANKPVNWPTVFREQAKAKFSCEVTLENPAIGGTQLRQGLVLLPRWKLTMPEPDLVVVCYGSNDYDAGMRGPEFKATVAAAVDRIRRATGGKADVLLVTTVPGAKRWTLMSELAEAVRSAAGESRAGLADVEKAFHAAAATEADRPSLFCRDEVHLGPKGHALFAETVLRAIAGP